jgi:hypothetical protein
MTTTIFTEFLSVMDAQIDVQGGNIEFPYNCAAHAIYVISVKPKTCVSSTKT